MLPIRVELTQLDDRVRITLEDWGVGFNAEKLTENMFGIEGIKERSRLLGGHATIETSPGHGTCIVTELPLAVAE